MHTLEELRKLDKTKILAEIKKVEKDLFKSRFNIRSGQGKAGHKIREQRKYIAQMKTIIHETSNEEPNPKS
jgi:ribosomal protein L29